MPAVIPIIAAAVSTGGTIYAAKKQGDAARHATDAQTSAANTAAQAEKEASAKAEAFQREQAENEYRQQEAARAANYQQYKAKYAAVRNLGQSLGFDVGDLPDYTPLPDPRFTGGTGSPTSASDPAVAFIRDYQSTHPATSSPADLVAAAKAKGLNITPFMYGNVQSNNEVTVNGQKFKIRGGEDGPNPYWYTGGDDSAPGAGRANLATMLAPRAGSSLATPIDPAALALAPPPRRSVATLFGR